MKRTCYATKCTFDVNHPNQILPAFCTAVHTTLSDSLHQVSTGSLRAQESIPFSTRSCLPCPASPSLPVICDCKPANLTPADPPRATPCILSYGTPKQGACISHHAAGCWHLPPSLHWTCIHFHHQGHNMYRRAHQIMLLRPCTRRCTSLHLGRLPRHSHTTS